MCSLSVIALPSEANLLFWGLYVFWGLLKLVKNYVNTPWVVIHVILGIVFFHDYSWLFCIIFVEDGNSVAGVSVKV